MFRFLPALALLAPMAASAVPLQLTHQGRILDSTGVALDGDTSVTFALYDSNGATEALWSEAQTVPFDAGFFTVSLGADTTNPLVVDDLDVTELWIGIAVGSDPELERLPVDSVPYALLAHSVIGGKVQASEVTVGATTIGSDGAISVGGTTVIGADGAIAGSAVTGLPEDSDTLAGLNCSSVVGDAVAQWDGSEWTCQAANAHLHDADDIASGTLSIDRLPVGREVGKVMPGDATFSAADVGALPSTTTAADIGGLSGADECDSSDDLGNFRFSDSGVEFCDGDAWRAMAFKEDGSKAGPFRGSCSYVKSSFPAVPDGTYWVDVDGPGPLSAVQAECDMTTDGGGWTRFWWYTPNTDLVAPIDMLGKAWGECAADDAACLGRIPGSENEDETELLAKDSANNVFKWQFNSRIVSAHAAWNAFANHRQVVSGPAMNAGVWNPTVLAGTFAGRAQDSFMYRTEAQITGFILDDDNCDCYTTLSAGHGMCQNSSSGGSYSTQGMIGVDVLSDTGCDINSGPKKSGGLQLYFR